MLEKEFQMTKKQNYIWKNDRNVALSAGCTEYITKPYRAETLRKTISKLLNLE